MRLANGARLLMAPLLTTSSTRPPFTVTQQYHGKRAASSLSQSIKLLVLLVTASMLISSFTAY